MKALLAVLLTLALGTAWAAQPAAVSPPLKGEVLEFRDADPYTYLRLKTAQGETWAAVMKAPVKKGEQVTIMEPMTMANFESKALKMKFDSIVFGTLAGAAPPSMGAAVPASAPASAMGANASPHGNAAKPADVPVEKVAKAAGPDARTVAEVFAQRAQLKGKTVVVRGKIVKFASNIMGKNWVHLRDGSGSAKDGTNDLVVTTKQDVKAGEVMTARGVVNTDVDIGMGVKYKVLLEDATFQK
jgi:hypothetical protein